MRCGDWVCAGVVVQLREGIVCNVVTGVVGCAGVVGQLCEGVMTYVVTGVVGQLCEGVV